MEYYSSKAPATNQLPYYPFIKFTSNGGFQEQ